MIALDAKTGQVLWDALGAADPTKHEAFNSAPIAWQGKVFIGISVGDSDGLRCQHRQGAVAL